MRQSLVLHTAFCRLSFPKGKNLHLDWREGKANYRDEFKQHSPNKVRVWEQITSGVIRHVLVSLDLH